MTELVCAAVFVVGVAAGAAVALLTADSQARDDRRRRSQLHKEMSPLIRKGRR